MTSKATILKQLQTNKARLAEDFYIQEIGLFGSYSKGQPGPKSDIDLVFELEEGEKIGFKALIELEDFLKNLYLYGIFFQYRSILRSQ